jgi:putative DNA primase/helicase
MHREFFDFRPTHKLWMYGNHKPTIRGADEGIWRRIMLVPFTVSIPESERDPHFRERCLMPELPGILAWAVRGCLAWQAEGLRPPAEVRGATQEYRAEMDVLSTFIGECCVLDEQCEALSSVLYKAYRSWCEQVGEHPTNIRDFAQEMERRGFLKRHAHGGEMRKGIAPRTAVQEQLPGEM